VKNRTLQIRKIDRDTPIISLHRISKWASQRFATHTPEGIAYARELTARTCKLQQTTMEDLLDMRRHDVAEVKAINIGTIDLMQLFIWDFRTNDFKLHPDYSKRLFGRVMPIKTKPTSVPSKSATKKKE